VNHRRAAAILEDRGGMPRVAMIANIRRKSHSHSATGVGSLTLSRRVLADGVQIRG
jgi:hypothetical protein